ncbi:uncharacterized protein RAG0_11419 [Rhynchosporium agropyri]|uniref:Uncharacterized protein n=1 Tax=Rhynchosporium agropyri TaxID=914238 RepID=A0A1E1L405_9HELO|nr:uncharacterized protein RAG0_11419 [Rhynchosporium agropyri]
MKPSDAEKVPGKPSTAPAEPKQVAVASKVNDAVQKEEGGSIQGFVKEQVSKKDKKEKHSLKVKEKMRRTGRDIVLVKESEGAYWEPLPAAASTGMPVPLPFTATAMFRAQDVSALRSQFVTTSSITSRSPRLSIYDLTSDEDEVQFLGSGSVERIRATTNAESLDARFAVLESRSPRSRGKNHTLETQVASLQSQTTALRIDVSMFRGKNAALEIDVLTLETRNNSPSLKVSTLESD